MPKGYSCRPQVTASQQVVVSQRKTSDARKRMIDRIDDDCANALGFKDSSAALKQLKKTTLSYDTLGIPTYVNGKLVSGEAAITNPVTDSIRINSNINWNDLQHQSIVVDGKTSVGDLLAGEAHDLGVSSVTSTQYYDLVILHELAHTRIVGGKNPDKLSVEKNIWEKCIRW